MICSRPSSLFPRPSSLAPPPSFVLSLCGFIAILTAASAEHAGFSAVQADPARSAVPQRSVTLRKAVPLSEALNVLRAQTGNAVGDRRLTKTNPVLSLNLTQAGFWPALEEIARQADARISPYDDGGVALVEGPYRPVPRSNHGLFRVALKRRTLSHDEDTGQHSCVIQLEVAWEPRFQPFYLSGGASRVVFSRDRDGKNREVKVPGQGALSVAGRSAIEVDLRMPAPDRSAARIDNLKGEFHVIGPSKMLAFTFDSLKTVKPSQPAPRQTQEGVTVRLKQVAVRPDRWTFDVFIDNLPGGPQFESYQSWLDNNRIYLEKGEGRDRQLFLPQNADEEQLENITARHAAIRYHFTTRGRNQPPPGKLEDWRLVYRTPGRIVELTVPFTFKDLRLP